MITLSTLVASYSALKNLAKEPLPISMAWELSKFIKATSSDMETFEAIRNNKIKEYGEPEVKEGRATGVYVLIPANFEKFNAEISEVLSKEIATAPPALKASELIGYKDQSGKGVSLSAADMVALEWLIKDTD